jgi:hypothetical protein
MENIQKARIANWNLASPGWMVKKLQKLKDPFERCNVLTNHESRGNAVIRVYDDAGNVIETHEHHGEFKEW